MKTRTLVFFCVLCLAVLIILGSCSTMKSPDKMTYERFCGTWANEDYEPKPGLTTPSFAKWIFNPDGTFLGYRHLIETGPTEIGTYIVEKRWADSDNNSWYHIKTYWPLSGQGSYRYELWKLDKNNAVLEMNTSNNDYPSEIDPKDFHTQYTIFYRF